MKRTSDMAEVFDKSAIEVTKPKERLQLFLPCWNGPFGDSLDFGGIHAYATFFHDHAQVLNLRLLELALLGLEIELVLP